MKTIIALFSIIFLFNNAYCQKFPQKFGQISKEEIDLNHYDKDPEASGIVLFDKGNSFFIRTDYGYEIQFTRTKRLKIFNKNGFKYAEVSIPYYVDGYGKTESIRDIEAFTYNFTNGRIDKKALDQKIVFEEIINDRWRVKKFVFPNVKAGSIIEYRYKLNSPFHFNLPDWKFQDEIPTLFSEYIVHLIPFYEYVFIAQGLNQFTYQNSEKSPGIPRKFNGIEFSDMIHTYRMENISAFKDESYITSPEDYIKKIDFQLSAFHSTNGSKINIISTWQDLTKSLLKHDRFGKYISKCKKLATEILETELIFKNESEEQKAKEITEYVKNNFNWDGYNSKYASKSPKEFFKQKTGNSADINLFLISMLQAAKINVSPVILSTRNHGRLASDYPFEHFFNYIIPYIKLDSNSYLTDGTEGLLAYNRIPPRCINDRGLVIEKEKQEWLTLNSNLSSLKKINLFVELDSESFNSRIKGSIQTTEFESFSLRKALQDDSEKIIKDLKRNGFSSINEVNSANFNNPTKAYLIGVNGESENEIIENKLLISPFLHFPIQENTLTQKERTYPIDFTFRKSMDIVSNINIPKNYKLLELPSNFKMDNKLAKIQISYTKTDNGLNVSGTYDFKKAIYAPNEYQQVKRYMDLIISKFNKQIIIEMI